MTLTNLQIENAEPSVQVDGNGLNLSVSSKETGSRIFRYQLKRKRHEMAWAAKLKAQVAGYSVGGSNGRTIGE